MLKIVLALLGIGMVHANGLQLRVIVDYNAPTIKLQLPIYYNKVTSVIFRYGVGSASQNGSGVFTADYRWQFIGELKINVGEIIIAYADVFQEGVFWFTTPTTTLLPKSTLAMGTRRIRAVIFRDDFNSFNRDTWRPEVSMFGGMNWEFQVYTPESKNIYARDGNLYLRPTLTTDDPRFGQDFLRTGKMDMFRLWGQCTNNGNYGCYREGKNGLLPPIMSGKVVGNPTIRFGTVEVRAKIPRGDWLWPAIWMMPQSNVYGGWPRSGEIDIMESRGNVGNLGVRTVSSTLHWGPASDQNRFGLTTAERRGENFHKSFHIWRLEWTPSYIRTFVDNQQILNVDVGAGFWAKGGFTGQNIWERGSKMAPFDQDFYLMFNVAVGGTNGFFPDNVNWGVRKPWANNSPRAAEDFWNARNDWLPSWQGDKTALQIDYVEFRNK